MSRAIYTVSCCDMALHLRGVVWSGSRQRFSSRIYSFGTVLILVRQWNQDLFVSIVQMSLVCNLFFLPFSSEFVF